MKERIVKPETMNPADKQATYDGFMTLTKWSSGAIVLLLVAMAIFLV